LIAALSGLLRPDEGKVTALDQDLWALRPGRIDRFRLDHCGFIFQGFNLFPALTALQQVTTVLKYQGLSRSKARDYGRRNPDGGRVGQAAQPAPVRAVRR
jgi:putative ABC transport system ATP-binding protein